ncbi:hypothetical protein MOQ72_40480 [Saccharopolyspora sp. K220]|uniref:hypothetical protein n=1 Tax=Saccharopolyspora soli TaxID=2926618 RepID=UPI001F570796|nr:hypothetical protein [Saccharopolyspora soli]MCI2423702.1 hypothetical protein [Saccharopolyspora soli]
MTAMPLETLAQLDILAQAEVGTAGIRTWILENLLPLLLLTVAVLLLWLGGGKGDNAGVMRRVGGVIVALAIIGLAVNGAGVNIGTFIAGLFSSSGG